MPVLLVCTNSEEPFFLMLDDLSLKFFSLVFFLKIVLQVQPSWLMNILFLVSNFLLHIGLGEPTGGYEESKEAQQSCVFNAEGTVPPRRQDSLCNQAKWCPSSQSQVWKYCLCIWDIATKRCLKPKLPILPLFMYSRSCGKLCSSFVIFLIDCGWGSWDLFILQYTCNDHEKKQPSTCNIVDLILCPFLHLEFEM